MDGKFKKAAVLLTLDFQTIEEKTCLFLEENFDLIAALNKSNWSKNVSEGVQLGKMTQNWWEFVNRNDHKILPFFHFISDYEFNWSQVPE